MTLQKGTDIPMFKRWLYLLHLVVLFGSLICFAQASITFIKKAYT